MAENEKAAAEAVAEKSVKKKAGRPKGSKNKRQARRVKGGAGKRYDAETKAAILAATEGKSLAEAHIAAVEAGYKGSPASLYQMIHNAKKKKGKRGRPKGSKNIVSTPKPDRLVKPSNNGLSAIDTIISREVQSRINAAANDAIRELEKLIK